MRRYWTRLPRWARLSLAVLAALATVLALLVGALLWYSQPEITRTDGVVYGTRHGEELTLDILQPENANGLGIAVIMSGGWKSGGSGSLDRWVAAPLLRRGYTVFAVSHVSQPRASVMEIIEDVNRGIRFIRHKADDYGIDSRNLGVTGGSAGGHLSLMLATRGGPGPADADDPIDRESSAVQAVAIFYPVTDLLNLGPSTENPGDGGPPKSFVKAFGPRSTEREIWKEIGRQCSPIYHVHAEMPPVLIHHGDADTLTPLEQSMRFQAACRDAGVGSIEIRVHPGGEHGWSTMPWDLWRFANWFDRHLPSPVGQAR